MPQTIEATAPLRAIDRAGLALELAGSADDRAMQEAERRGNVLDMPLRLLLTRWWTYTAITRTPELRSEVRFFRDRARHAVRAYRAAQRVPVQRREAA